jgi:hypothetical protein
VAQAARTAPVSTAREGIQQHPVAARVQQAAVVVLAMQFHQCVGQGAQHLGRHAAVIGPGAAAAVGGGDAAQDQGAILGRNPGLGQHGMGGVKGGQVEFGCHLALIGASADKVRPCAPAQHEAQRIQQDRLARPGFAGQHVQTRLQGQRQAVDDQKIADIQRAQHGPCPRRQSHSPRMTCR